jgi:hypothetical protein
VIIVVVSVDLVVFYESIEPLLPEPDVLSDLGKSKLARSAQPSQRFAGLAQVLPIKAEETDRFLRGYQS